ncbi:MAG: P1 family peptidase [Pseudomonadota bacterium]
MAGKRNLITDVPGLKVGQAEDKNVESGVSVILFDEPAIVAGDVRGGGPGTRETDLLDPSTLVQKADAIVLAGGSTYGLAAADGVAAWLGARGRGFTLIPRDGVPPSPIVPAAILYDLANGGDKAWGHSPPYRDLGIAACETANDNVELGKAGAGFGASAGAFPGGVGSASAMCDDISIGALVAVNSFGSPKMPGTEVFWAWPFEQGAEFGGYRPPTSFPGATDLPPDTKLGAAAAKANTTIGLVAIAARLSQADAQRVAVMAQDGLARALRPVHGPTDGDVIFVAATDGPPLSDPLSLTRLGMIAADCVARAIARGVYEAERQK